MPVARLILHAVCQANTSLFVSAGIHVRYEDAVGLIYNRTENPTLQKKELNSYCPLSLQVLRCEHNEDFRNFQFPAG